MLGMPQGEPLAQDCQQVLHAHGWQYLGLGRSTAGCDRGVAARSWFCDDMAAYDIAALSACVTVVTALDAACVTPNTNTADDWMWWLTNQQWLASACIGLLALRRHQACGTLSIAELRYGVLTV